MRTSEAKEIVDELVKRWPKSRFDVSSQMALVERKTWEIHQAMEAIEWISEEGYAFPSLGDIEKQMYASKVVEGPGQAFYDDGLAKSTLTQLRAAMRDRTLRHVEGTDSPDRSRSTLQGFVCSVCRDSGWSYAFTDSEGYAFVLPCKLCPRGEQNAARDDLKSPYAHHRSRGPRKCGCTGGLRPPGIPCSTHWPDAYRRWVAQEANWKTAPKPSPITTPTEQEPDANDW